MFGPFFLVLTGIDDRKWRNDEKIVETYQIFQDFTSRDIPPSHHKTLLVPLALPVFFSKIGW